MPGRSDAISDPVTVLKFGGTSVGTAEAIRRAVAIVSATAAPRVVVVSATAGTTDSLADAAAAAARGDGDAALRIIDGLTAKHAALALELAGAPLPALGPLAVRARTLLEGVRSFRECSPRTLDALWAYGERASSLLVAAALDAAGLPAEAISADTVIRTDDTFGDATPSGTDAAPIRAVLAAGRTAVVTGFIGGTADGVVTTLGRGGSDYSAALVAAALRAGELRIFTDVSGVFSADPRIVPDARPLPSLSYAEAAELSYFGAKVIHPRTVRPAVELGIPVLILNTFDPDADGTRITGAAAADGSVVKATTALGGLGLVTVQGAGMSGVPGFAAKVFDTAAAERVSVLMISQSSSENAICFIVPANVADRLRRSLEHALARELGRHDVERVSVEAPVAIVAAVGEGMRGTPGVAARVFGALGAARVNVMAIAQGSSELNISLCVAERDKDAAVRAIDAEFRNGGRSH